MLAWVAVVWSLPACPHFCCPPFYLLQAIGDQIIAARRRALVATALAGWRFRARVGREVQARLGRLMRGALAAAWAAWRRYHAHKVGLGCEGALSSCPAARDGLPSFCGSLVALPGCYIAA